MAVGQCAHTFVGQASFLAVRAFIPQGAMHDSVNINKYTIEKKFL